MKKAVKLDGLSLELAPKDLDGDGIVGGKELITQNAYNQQDIISPGELKESLQEINKDTVDPETKLNSLDMRSRLHPIEISSMMAINTIGSMRFLPQESLRILETKLRYSISLHGEGRKEMRDVIVGKREHDQGTNTFMDKLKLGVGIQPNTQQ